MDLELYGKCALVTGSSSGIGAGIAKVLAGEGVSVIVHGRDREKAGQVADTIVAAGGKAAVVTGDLANDAGAAAVATQAIAAFGAVDILVNNAGGRFKTGASVGLFEITDEDWEQTFQMNVMAAARLIRALCPAMKERQWGRVINISTAAASAPSGAMAEYAAAKAAMNNLTVGVSRAMAGSGVTANTVSAGMIETPAFEEVLISVQKRMRLEDDRAKAVKWLTETTMRQTVKRLGRPEDIGFAIAMLSSPRGDFITGANIRVDGGASPSVN